MLIKKSIRVFKLKPFFKKKSVLILLIFFLNSLFFTYLGMYAYKYNYHTLLKKFIFYENSYRISVVKNFLRKPFIKIDKIDSIESPAPTLSTTFEAKAGQ